MGTTNPNRFLNTEGSKRKVSEFALVHSEEGAFTKSQVRTDGEVKIKLRLHNGGHGQKGMDLLDKYGIGYHILKTYPNGVRVGNVSNHIQRFKREFGGQTWFPKNWSQKDMKRAGEHVAGLKQNRHIKDGQKMYGMYKGVRVGVVKTHGKIATVFPAFDQPRRKKSKNNKHKEKKDNV